MQTESQKSQLRSISGTTEVFFDGGSVVVPIEKENRYKEVLADFEWNGSRVIVREGKTHSILADKCKRGMDIESCRNLTINYILKNRALDGIL